MNPAGSPAPEPSNVGAGDPAKARPRGGGRPRQPCGGVATRGRRRPYSIPRGGETASTEEIFGQRKDGHSRRSRSSNAATARDTAENPVRGSPSALGRASAYRQFVTESEAAVLVATGVTRPHESLGQLPAHRVVRRSRTPVPCRMGPPGLRHACYSSNSWPRVCTEVCTTRSLILLVLPFLLDRSVPRQQEAR